MRHSFLPIQEQKIFKKEYLYHIAVVALFLLAATGLVGVCSLFPAYIYVYIEGSSINDTIVSSGKDKNISEILGIEKELRSDMLLINSLSESFSSIRYSDLIEQITSARGPISIDSIRFESISTSTATIFLSGTAPTRESLISFKTRLETLNKGNKVDLPISGLAKNKDISFSLKVIKSLQ
ncbi:MAG: hypothetical protein AAB470_01975 [Patescibacteria group bacterium]